MLHDYVMSEDGLCGQFGDRAEVAALLSEHDTRQVDHNLSLWTLLAAEVWYRDVFRPQSIRL